MVTESTRWTQMEFEQLDLGDARLNKRARLLMERMAADPTANVPQACQGWGETIAAYRFFDNEKVQWHAILEPHWQQTQKRMQAHQVVLCLQDTTELDFKGQDALGLGPLTYEAQHGMFVHPTYAVTPQREQLGILDTWMWAREKKDDSGQRGGPKESLRWIEGYERIAEMAPDMRLTRLVYVADREADLIALMERADDLGKLADWLVRASHNRSLPEGDKLWERATCGEAVGEIAFPMAARQGVKARTVHQRLWLQRVQLAAASKGKASLQRAWSRASLTRLPASNRSNSACRPTASRARWMKRPN